MAEIEQPMPGQGVSPWQRGDGGSQRGRRRRAGGYDEEGRRPDQGGGYGHAPADTFSISGLGHEDLSPRVQALLAELGTEIERLRFEVERLKHRQEILEDLADQHAYLPVVNRRAFLRELGLFLAHLPQKQVESVLALFYLENFEALHHDVGLHAAEEAMVHMARQVTGAVRASDTVGSVGGPALAVLMVSATPDGAMTKAESLAATINARPLTRPPLPDTPEGEERHGSGVITLHVICAITPLDPLDSAEAALERADTLLRHQTRPPLLSFGPKG